MVDTLSHVSFVRLAVTLQAIWWARRKAIHDEIFRSPLATYGFICRFIDELNMKQTKISGTTGLLGRTRVRPKTPPPGYMKIHVDAATARNQMRGAATVCCDGEGNYMGSSSLVTYGINDATTLEAIACQEALSLAEDLMLQNFVVASYSKHIVKDIEKGSQGAHGNIIREINSRS